MTSPMSKCTLPKWILTSPKSRDHLKLENTAPAVQNKDPQATFTSKKEANQGRDFSKTELSFESGAHFNQRRTKGTPRRVQKAHREPKGGSSKAQKGPKRAKGGPKRAEVPRKCLAGHPCEPNRFLEGPKTTQDEEKQPKMKKKKTKKKKKKKKSKKKKKKKKKKQTEEEEVEEKEEEEEEEQEEE